jgi:hypothetical protein
MKNLNFIHSVLYLLKMQKELWFKKLFKIFWNQTILTKVYLTIKSKTDTRLLLEISKLILIQKFWDKFLLKQCLKNQILQHSITQEVTNYF